MPEIRVLENDNLRIEVCDHGAELCSIYNRKAKKETLWTADPAYWGRHAPVLFPFVGKVTEGFYTYKGQKYPMGQHGFARDRDFVLVESGEDRLVHRLESDEESRKVYPFDFCLEVVHKLQGNCVTVEWRVKNTGDETMYFSIGGHPGFLVGKQAGSRLVFEGKESLTRVAIDPLTEGVDVDHPEEISLKEGVYLVDSHTFDRDALIFDGGQIKKVGLVTPEGEPLVTMVCPDALSVGIWAPGGGNSPFICLEPWIGRCDNSGFRGELSEKYDVQSLEAGESFVTSYDLWIGEVR